MPPHHHPLPSPLLFLTQPLQLSVSFTPKETRSCQLLRKGGCFEGAGVPESTPFSYFTPRKACRSLRKKFSSSLSVVQLIATPLSLSGCKCHFHSVMFYTTKEFHRITAVSWHNVIIHGHFCIVLLLKILQLIKMWIALHGAQIGTLVTRFRLPSEWQSHWYLANKKSVL